MKPTIGRLVHYVLRDEDYGEKSCYAGQEMHHHRPAMIVEVWGEHCVNLLVFTDEPNDGRHAPICLTSVSQDGEMQPGTWHWPERED